MGNGSIEAYHNQERQEGTLHRGYSGEPRSTQTSSQRRSQTTVDRDRSDPSTQHDKVDGRTLQWIASYPKSGNTWVRMFLSAYLNGGNVAINSAHSTLSDDLNAHYYRILSLKPLSQLTQYEVLALRPATLLYLRDSSPKNTFVKTHNAVLASGGVSLIPNHITKRAIYIVRDPRDICISLASHCEVSIDTAIEMMNSPTQILRRGDLFHVISSWSSHVASWSGRKNYPVIVVKYYNLLQDPVSEFKKLLNFCEIEIDTNLLLKSVENSSFRRLKEQEEASKFVENPSNQPFFRVGKAGNWKKVLSDEQSARIESNHHDMMVKFGYL